MLVEGNVFENNWKDAQDGFAFVLKAENQSGGAPWTTDQDITIRDNYIKGTGNVFNLSASGSQPTPNVPGARFLITNNLVEAVSNGPLHRRREGVPDPQRAVGPRDHAQHRDQPELERRDGGVRRSACRAAS